MGVAFGNMINDQALDFLADIDIRLIRKPREVPQMQIRNSNSFGASFASRVQIQARPSVDANMNKAPSVANDDSDKAVKTLVNGLNSEQFKAIKDEVATYDLTSISQRELVKLGRLLYDADLIDGSVFSAFIYADGDFDASGRQQNQDKLINAYAAFEYRLWGSTDLVASGGWYAQDGVDLLTKVNQVSRALAQFTTPDSKDQRISIFA